ncbi:hypothetical protein LCGC14_1390050 [marine sediment metagenome]|uniref:ParB/Sulfiredoxin domain-containing protein n=1 Tax=marine sediment metagenome TaxID=412755 RepID=A0A0F9N1T0_9ZZZZ
MERRIVKDVLLKDVVFDEEVYPRTNVYWLTSFDYSNSLKAGAKFPPITLALHNKKLILVDGKHRIDAFKICKEKTIPAEIYTGWDRKKIFIESIKRNIAHGRVLSPYEKRLCIMKLREMKINSADVSEIIQIPQKKLEHFVGQRLISSTTGEKLDVEVVKSGLKQLAGRSYEKSEIQMISGVQKGLSIGDQFSLFKQMIYLLEGGLVDLEDKRIQESVNKLFKLIKPLREKSGWFDFS